jgi:hypothetical protein
MFAASKTASVSGGYQISRSLRFNSADSAYLNRTPASAGNRRTWTFSAWVKLSALTGNNILFSASNGSSTQFYINFSSANTLDVVDYSGSTQLQKTTTQVFRDPSAFYHLVVVLDTTQASASNRFRLYINGVEVTAFSGTNITPSQNYDGALNSTVPHAYGRDEFGDNNYYSGYLTETYLIDGQALTPSSFGETNAQTGVWQPKAYSGSYGTNGFYLNFSNNSNTTAATLGKDYSGNGNNWTPNNFSVTAGAGNDSLVDSPTSYGTDTGVGGTVRGNYNTWNPLQTLGGTGGTVSNGNLDFSIGTSQNNVASTLFVTSGKWYCEITPTAITGTSIGEITINDSNGNIAVGYRSTGTKDVDSYSTNAAYGATWTVGDTIGVAFDVDNKQVTFYKNGISQGAITYTGSALTTNSMGVLCAWRTSATFAGTANFGQRPFAYTAPSGFKALCTQNLPVPSIGATTATQANKYFDAVTYSGSSSSQTVVNSGAFQPDLVWAKSRSNAYNNILVDSLRGGNLLLISNSTAADTSSSGLATFVSNGITWIGGATGVNDTGVTYVDWMWKANGSGSTNTAGSITSTVSANTTSGFSVVTYTGTGANATVGHGLGATPSMVIVKRRNSAEDWQVRHISIAAVNSIELNLTGGASSSPTTWNSTNPTSTVFSIGTDTQVNASGGTYVAYCFAPIAGYSSMGSYVGNGSTEGPFIFTGMRPAFVLVRRSDGSDDWYLFDNKRIGYNVRNEPLYPNGNYAEGSGFNYIDLLSNGFKMRNNSYENVSGANYIYAAFAESPFKYSLAR